jgi:hypothetical protein
MNASNAVADCLDADAFDAMDWFDLDDGCDEYRELNWMD